MAFRIHSGHVLEDEVRRVATEQISKAIQEIDDPELSQDETVHQVRKRCKKLRGLIRLVRPSFETTYQNENAWFRDTARRLSEIRDSRTMLDTYDALMEHYEDQVRRPAFGPLRRHLTEERKHLIEDAVDVPQRLQETRQRLKCAAKRCQEWTLNGSGFKAMAKGMSKTYRRARKAFCKASKSPSNDTLHAWRKRVKYHRYHCKLLREAWPEVMKARQNEADRLGSLLGSDHDLAVLKEIVSPRPDLFHEKADGEAFLALLEHRRCTLQKKSFHLGRRLLAEPSEVFAQRMEAYWTA